jgi:hypothetical protein
MRSAILRIVVGCMMGFHTDALAIVGPLCAVASLSASSCNSARLDPNDDDDDDDDDDASKREERGKLSPLPRPRASSISSRLKEPPTSNATRHPRSVHDSTMERKMYDLIFTGGG